MAFPFALRSQTEKDAASLNLANGYLYAATSGYFGDAPPYVGHVVAVHLSDGAAHVFNSLCSNDRQLPTPTSCSRNLSGIWSRAGVVVDPDPSMRGRIYFATGNGDFNAASGGHDYGDSVLALSADATTVLGYYTPSTYSQLEQGDTDLGSTAPALLPRQPRSKTPLMLVQGGKDATLRLLDREHLPGVGGELQRVELGDEVFSAPAVWRDQSGQTREGTSPVLEGDVVFVAMDREIVALNARTGAKIWSSAGSGHSIGPMHWESPIVAGSRLYCSDENGRLTAFGL